MNWRRILIVAGILVVAGGLFAFFDWRHHAAAKSQPAQEKKAASKTQVDVVHPTPGGLPRSTTQPATVYSFGIANLFAQVSGYLKTQSVDIGDVVEQGQTLAQIDVPNVQKQLQANEAELAVRQSKVTQAEAQVTTAIANWKTAQATAQESVAGVNKAIATRVYRDEAFHRIKALYEKNAIEERLVQEQQEQLEAARASEQSANAALMSAKAQVGAAQATIEQAKANVGEAQSEVQLAEAEIGKTEVLLQFAKIVAPFKGVIALRNYYPGDFVRAAQQGGTTPMLTVARTDLMRVVVQMPDDVIASLKVGAAATVSVDALSGQQFQGKVSRMSDVEVIDTRTMRVEIDLPNPKNVLSDGMFGSATVALAGEPKHAVTIPSSCLTGNVEDHHGQVYVVRNSKMYTQKVTTGLDDGIHVEVVDGLGTSDEVVTNYTGPTGNGTAVEAIQKDQKDLKDQKSQKDQNDHNQQQ
ncbi:MAG TPA: efflux RND transporter periplasmic adaptor subunit [Pirellulales bacterium]|jgi:RND family efflux transporter MFP subunit|nr:efflux RND transporter periplasmic adaptor subunit [Pirellulales bacterium]